MAEKKKNKSASSARTTKKQTPAKQIEKKTDEMITTVKKPAPKGNSKNQFWSVILFALGIMIFLLEIIRGSSGWYAIHNVIRGLFGFSVIFVPIILIYSALLIEKERSQDIVAGRALWGVSCMAITSAVIQIFFVGNIPGEDFIDKIKNLYKLGIKLEGGGVISGIVAWPLMKLFGTLGAKIIIILLLFVFIMLLTNYGLFDFLGLFYKPFKKFGKYMITVRDENAILREYDEEQKQEKIEAQIHEQEQEKEALDIINSKTAKPIKSTKSRFINLKKQPPEIHPIAPDAPFDMDIPVDGTALGKMTSSKSKISETYNTLDVPIVDRPLPEYVTAEPDYDDDDEPEVFIPKMSADNFDEADDDINIDIPPFDIEDERPKKADDDIESLINKAMEDSAKKKAEIAMGADDTSADELNQALATEVPKYVFPSIDMLKKSDTKVNDVNSTIELKQKADILVDTLKSFGVQTRIVGIHRGPSVTRYEVQPSAGVKISKITSLSDDIALNMAAAGVRIEAPIPGKAAVGIEIPNTNKDLVSLRDILESREFKETKSKLTFAVGKDIAGNVILGDVAKMPHVIIAGATGSGKSVCTNSIIMSILYNATPEEVRLVLIDPKIVEFKVYDGIPHLLIPVVTDPKKAAGALNWAVQEMLKRYKLFADNNVRDLAGYNEMADETEGVERIPQIVIAIDELADLMMAASKEVEDSICRLAQMARAAGMHLIIATQRPTVNIITGLIKANIPSRIALSVMSQTDSRTILDIGGAEKLLGHGDMLYFPNGMPKPIRVQGCFCSTKEIESVVEFIKSKGQAEYSEEVIEEIETAASAVGEKNSASNDGDDGLEVGSDADLIEKAIDIVVHAGQASTSMLQRRLKLGYARAARIIDELEEMGVVSESEGAKPRRVLMSQQEFSERRMRKLG